MKTYDAFSIRQLITTLASLYGVNERDLKTVGETAMVMWGLADKTDKIRLGMTDSKWRSFSVYHKCRVDAAGIYVALPGEVYICALDDIQVKYTFDEIDGFSVASLSSLYDYCRRTNTTTGEFKPSKMMLRINELLLKDVGIVETDKGSTNSLRERFIEDTRRVTDVRRGSGLDYRISSHKGQEGRFLNKHTHAMWLGYQLAHTAAFHDDKVESEESVLMGRYVIMNRVGPGVKVKSSHHPFVHRSRKTALDEAERLTLEHDSEFVVFRCVATRVPKTITEVTTNA